MPKFPIKTVVLSSLSRVFPEQDPSGEERTVFSCMKNEPLSFQVAYKLKAGFAMPVNLKIVSDLPLSLYSQGAVPVQQVTEEKLEDDYRPGLVYDMLLKKSVNPPLTRMRFPKRTFWFDGDSIQLHAVSGSWKALWLTVNENEKRIAPGTHRICLQLLARSDNSLVGECELTVQVVDACLPKQKLIYTNWFHCDCLCDTYGVEMFSRDFWRIFRNFVKAAAKNGMNMLLTPCFTPPLDTSIGGQRKTAQLVGVTVTDGKYCFDFRLLERFIREAQSCGIQYFEHSHLFTQWGAEHAPKIMATVNGRYTQLFGWKTKATGKKYQDFLKAYIPQLRAFLQKMGLEKKVLFHISDEPNEEVKENYLQAKALLQELLEGCMVGDAMSHYSIYKDVKITTPIVATDFVQDFRGKCKNLWAYYTGNQCTDGMSNRKLNCTPERNRILGLSLYAFNIKGFLHWGYNFYYDMLSCGIFDPKVETCFYGGTNAGTSFFVYPGTDGSCIPSARQKVFYEAIHDMRALQLLENRIGRKATLEFLQAHYGEVDFHTSAGSAEKLLGFREALNEKIRKVIENGNEAL
ncbi:MAG: DUF4091 domain-containing protein [Oscillospiraceae bacterium]|nr:DUF4091 domain-containing protein [Oscillospiraceae bacterium]